MKHPVPFDQFDREMTAGFTATERWRFKWARAVFDVIVMRMIGRAYERTIINTRQMHDIAAIWKRICWPERPAPEEPYDRAEPAEDFRWYARGERDPKGTCVFAVFGEATTMDGRKVQYFTNVYDENSTAFEAFVLNGPWTHWHPLSENPIKTTMREVASEMSETARKVIDEELRHGGRLHRAR